MASSELYTDETHNLISADKVEGTKIFSRDGENIGTCKKVMINKLTGQVAYVVAQYGGVMGFGSDYYPLPWSVLDYDTTKCGYVINQTKEQLQNAPRYTATSEPDWSSRSYNDEVHKHYGVQPTYR